MNRNEIVEHVRVALAQVLNREMPELDEDARLFEDLSLDSTSVIELLMGLEDTIDLEIDPDELEPEVFRTVRTLSDFIEAGFAKAGAMVG
jgi:acyl carrier protein